MRFLKLNNRLEDWEKFVENTELGNFGQSSFQYELLLNRGRNVAIFGVVNEDNDILVGGVVNWDPTKFGYKFSLDYGPIIKDWHDIATLKFFFDGLVSFAKKNKGLYLSVSPNGIYQEFSDEGAALHEPQKEILNTMFELGFTHEAFKYGMQDTGVTVWQYVKKLDGQPYDVIKKSYHKMAKQYLKKNKLYGVTIRELTRDELPIFHKIIMDTCERRHFHGKDLNYFQTAYDKFGNQVKFVIAEVSFSKYIEISEIKLQNTLNEIEKLTQKREIAANKTRIDKQLGELYKQKQNHKKRIEHGTQMRIHAGNDVVAVAAAMFIIMPQETDYLFSGSYEEYSEFYAPYQIQDYMINMSQKLGVQTYNFLGIDGVFDGSDGVLKFKTQFDGVVQQLIGTFILPIKNVEYHIYKDIKRVQKRYRSIVK